MSIQEAQYTVTHASPPFELRNYAQQIVAETVVESSLEDAGNMAFRKLFVYISGKNTAGQKIAMTAPVTQETAGEKIAMTAPVGQQRVAGGWSVSFMMPATFTMETLPRPDDPTVTVRLIPATRMAAVRYSGVWSESRYKKHLEELQAWISQENHTPAGNPVWARYNPPFTPWFLRRNEILIPLSQAAQQEHE